MPRRRLIRRAGRGRDVIASLIVFLVALPLCLGIALASGATPAQGIITGIVGGIVTGTLSGSPLQVSGPAAGLTVVVFDLIRDHSAAALGPAVLAAGLVQIALGLAGAGQVLRRIPHSIVEAMMAAIGLSIIASQMMVAGDLPPRAGAFANVSALPGALPHANPAALLAAGLSLGLILLWERAAPDRLRMLPAPLLGVACATLAAGGLGLAVRHIALPPSLLHAVQLPRWGDLGGLASQSGAVSVLSLALIASIESLLSAAAVQRMTGRRGRGDFDRELMAQGIGNACCGMLGALPMTGVIVRSAANVRAGARSRNAAVLHGVWLLLLVELAPGVLRLVPSAALAGVLLLVGVRLVSLHHLRGAYRDGAILPYAATVLVALASNLLTGVACGCLLVWLLPRIAPALPGMLRRGLGLRAPDPRG